ncbi:MAG: hypothetical protein AB7O52_12630 [Planctomycetota bacterium]
MLVSWLGNGDPVLNFLAHARPYLGSPHFVAGTAVPDWLAFGDPKLRLAHGHPLQAAPDAGPATTELIAGVRRHLADDHAFHASAAFERVSGAITADLRHHCRDAGPRFRANFLGHLLTELLLDAALTRSEPDLPDRYYRALAAVDPDWVERAVRPYLVRPGDLAGRMRAFQRARFLLDYGDDHALWVRVGQVAKRIGLPPPPAEIVRRLPQYREQVAAAAGDLLANVEQGRANDESIS